MAENIFNNIELREKKGHTAKSAGIYAETLLEMSPNAKLALKKIKERCFHIKPTQFTPAMLGEYDLIVCMTKRHQEQIGSYDNVKTLDELADCGDVLDPYGADLKTYVVVAKQLKSALAKLYEKL
jgi:protein-tyrosine-phosphatase